MAVTAELDHSVVAETYAGHLSRYRVGDGGNLLDREVYATFGDVPTPDGNAIDAECGAWFGSPRTHESIRVRTGVQTDRIDMGERDGIACALGDADGRTLFLLGSQ